jgi:hypothetical protein
MSVLNVPVQIRRDVAANMPTIMLAGELYYQTDTNLLYIGIGSGVAKVSGIAGDIQAALNLKAPLANPSFTGVVQIGANDLALSRLASGSLALGNGAPADISGMMTMGSFLCHSGGADMFAWVPGNSSVGLRSGVTIAWGSSSYLSYKVGISDLGVASLGIGNGNSGNTSGKLTMANINVAGLTVYANNAAAITGGLAAGDFYRNGANPDLVCVVH